MPLARSYAPILLMVFLASSAEAQVDARMLRQPDVSQTHIAFVYAGDVWIVQKSGGTAQRLTSVHGEESMPRFSPDGSSIAFNGNYEGNRDIYVVPTQGGEPRRVTHHPWTDWLIDWYPDGASLLYESRMESGQTRYGQLYRTKPTGGMPEKLPVPYGEIGALSPDAQTLAYTLQFRDFRTWKRYRGGWASEIWLFDLATYESRNLTNDPANDTQPMWHGRTIYFLSDRGPNQRSNIWAYDLDGGGTRQVTRFSDFDIHFPAIGPTELVFEAAGQLYLMDLASEEFKAVDINVVTDERSLRPRVERVEDLIENAAISPNGKRALFEARGEIFTVPAEHGVIRNLTLSPGVAERFPTWSPDARHVAYWSDRSGEYQLVIRPADGSGEQEQLTSLGAGYRFRPQWSPDSRKLAFIDETRTIRIYDRESGEAKVVDQGLWMSHGQLSGFHASFSPDSRWLAYARGVENHNRAIFLYDTRTGERHQVTSGFYFDSRPVFDPEGKYLYFFSNRTFDLTFSDLQFSWIYANTTNVVVVPLRDDEASPLAPRNDDEEPSSGDEEAGEESSSEDGEEEAEEAEEIEIDLDGFERRLIMLPPEAGNYGLLQAASGKVVFLKLPRTGSGEEDAALVYYDLEEREEKTVLENVDWYSLSANGEKALVERDERFAIIDVEPEQKFENALSTARLEMIVDPRAEWRQLYTDAWRFQRDFFYDENMHGVDWDAMRDHYGQLLEHAVTRWDVNHVIGELIGELNASHTYRGGGDTENASERTVGMLGVDWALENGAFRIKTIIEGAVWDAEVRSPLAMPGIDIAEGDYILAVNGVPLDTSRDPWTAFQGLADQTVSLTVNNQPNPDGAREVLVETLSSEGRLRYLAWVEGNRRRVEEATDGSVGYIHVPNTSFLGHNELMRQLGAQTDKAGLIIDERFNSGGFLPDRLVELLDRPPLNFQARRHGPDDRWPRLSHIGPKVMLINGWAGSGGDAFPEFFRKAGLGPLIGTRTWGGRIGLTGSPRLIDGGSATVPTYRNYDPDGTWFAEGHGVEPDIHVPEDPTALARGTDPQLERAIEEVLRLLEISPPLAPRRPPREDRTAPATEARRQGDESDGIPR